MGYKEFTQFSSVCVILVSQSLSLHESPYYLLIISTTVKANIWNQNEKPGQNMSLDLRFFLGYINIKQHIISFYVLVQNR